MRSRIAILSVLCCVPLAALAQSARQETTISLPAGVSAQGGSMSRAGNLLAVICSDHIVRVWSVQSGEVIKSLETNAEPQTAVQFSRDGGLLAVAYEKGAVKIFDVDSWKLQYELPGSLPVYVLAFSPDSRRLATAGDFDTQVWDLPRQKKVATISPPFGWSWALSFSPDSRWVATADGDTFVRVYDANSGNLQSAVRGFLLEPMAVAFSSDGKTLLAGGVDKTISIVEATSGKISRAIPKHPGLIWALDISADGKQAVAVYRSSDRFFDVNHIALWDLDKGTTLADFQKTGITVEGGAFVGGHYLFAAASGNQLTLWSIP